MPVKFAIFTAHSNLWKTETPVEIGLELPVVMLCVLVAGRSSHIVLWVVQMTVASWIGPSGTATKPVNSSWSYIFKFHVWMEALLHEVQHFCHIYIWRLLLVISSLHNSMIETHVVEFDLDVSVPSEVAATTGKLDFAECLRLCRVLFSAPLGKIKHSAKVALPSARHSVKPGSWQN